MNKSIKLKSQNLQVLTWLRGNTLNPKQAIKLFKIYRLSARIYDLRKEGYNIKSIRQRHISGAGNVGYHCKYILYEKD